MTRPLTMPEADQPFVISLKEASRDYFGGQVSPRYLKAEVGEALDGWRFGDGTVITSAEFVQQYKEAMRYLGSEPIDGPGIYIIGYSRYVKIGVSTNIKQRLASLQTSVPHKLKTYAVLAGQQVQERSLHRRFKVYRLHGEWFRRSGKLAKWIEAKCP